MAIYKVKDLKTGQTTTTTNLEYLFKRLRNISKDTAIPTDEFNAFVEQITTANFLQEALDIKLEELNILDAITSVRDELDGAAAQQKRAKQELREFTATALSNVEDDNGERKSDDPQSTYKKVENIIGAGKQAPVHVLGWFKTKDKKGNTKDVEVAGATLPKHVVNTLNKIAEAREAKRTGEQT